MGDYSYRVRFFFDYKLKSINFTSYINIENDEKDFFIRANFCAGGVQQ